MKQHILPVLVLTLSSSCSSGPDRRPEFHDRLATIDGLTKEGELQSAHNELIGLMEKLRAAHDGKYAPQIVAAEAGMVQIHLAATDENAFLTRPKAQSFSLTGEAGGGVAPSTDAHRIAGMFHTWRLLDALDILGGDLPDGVLPATEARFADETFTRSFVHFALAGTLADLGFSSQARARLLEHPEFSRLLVPATAKAAKVNGADPARELVAVLVEHQIPLHMRWQIYTTAYEIFRLDFELAPKSNDPTLAFQFACLAALGELEDRDGIETHNPVVVKPDWNSRFYRWIDNLRDGHGQFLSDEPFAAGVTMSMTTAKPAIDFLWERTP